MDPLAQKIADFIYSSPLDRGRSGGGDADFNALACALFARQYALCAPYRRLCDSLGVTPDACERWQDIPAVPAQAFKRFDLSCVPLAETVAVFHSSGTTGAQTSRHYFDADALALYEISLRRGFDNVLPERPRLLWALMPPPAAAPHSSLSHMLGALSADRFFWEDDAALADALRTLAEPVALFGTAFAFVQFFDKTNPSFSSVSPSLEERGPGGEVSSTGVSLPPGSFILETGGFKGRTREVPREELYGWFETRLGVPLDHCGSEYGMSEMASQFYGRGRDPVKRGPHWVRTRAIDPVTGDETPAGTPGLLRHYDLANFNSVSALQTQDLGTQTPDGFVLHGRALDAPVRGCSLTVEELWASR